MRNNSFYVVFMYTCIKECSLVGHVEHKISAYLTP